MRSYGAWGVMAKEEFNALWGQYEPLIKGIVELFHPFVEVAVHDLEKGEIVAIYHNISKRKVGEASPLKEFKVNPKDFPDYFTPYYKENWNGAALKCTSITLKNKKGKPIGLICINVDVSVFKEGLSVLETFLKIKDEAENPVETFAPQFEDQAIAMIEQHLSGRQLSISHLNREQKKELVQDLYKKGVFNFKNATPFIAKKLGTSRASIYNYIKQIES